MSLVPRQIIASQGEYLPYFWSTIPFSTSSTPFGGFKWAAQHFSFSLLWAFSHSRTRLLLMFFLPLSFLSHQIVNNFIASFPWQTFKFLFARLEWPHRKQRFPSPSPEGCRVLRKVPWAVVTALPQHQLAEKRTAKSINIKRKEPQITLPHCEKTKLCLFHHSL